MFLRELRSPVSVLPGVGARTASLFQNLGVASIADLLLHAPRDYEDRSRTVTFAEAANGATANTIVRVVAHRSIGRGRRRTLKVIVEELSSPTVRGAEARGAEPGGAGPRGTQPDETPFGDAPRAALVCFGRNYLAKVLEVGKEFFLYGSFEYRYGELQSATFEAEPYVVDTAARAVLPIYPLTEGLSQGTVRRAVQHALGEYAVHLESEIPDGLRERHAFPEKSEALRRLHFPASVEDAARARDALAYDELFYLQLAVGRRAARRRHDWRPARTLDLALQASCLSRLPFTLTQDQRTSIETINRDLASNTPMTRLLQGEVGSGKTLVALLAALAVIPGGGQAALMAPTELLARQHAETASRFLGPLGVRLGLLSGNVKDPQRAELLRAAASGEIDLLIGTHALFTRGVAFSRLSLVIVDEQHRFGVLQRLALTQKGKTPDLLLMSATPIPRTLALTAFGDLEVSSLRTMPSGRRPVETHLAREGNREKVYAFVRRELHAGRQAYFVYPLIQQSAALDLKDAQSMYQELSRAIFPDARVALIHSRVDEEEKARIMRAFGDGRIAILVATSVVEVGVDVPNATVMVVEHAERFGLASLHQLRGRVGRGPHRSYCFYIYSEYLTEDGKRRLRVLKETNDGFLIAEEDLKLRGPGEIAGTRQSGAAQLAIADLGRDLEILRVARKDAFEIVEGDPGLLQPEHRVIREVLDRAPPVDAEMLEGG